MNLPMTRDMADAQETAQSRDAAWRLAALNRAGEPRTRTHAINPDTGEFTRIDQESDTMTDLPRTTITLTGDRGPLHVAKGVLVNGSPVTVAEHGVDIDFGPNEVTTVTLRLLADEVHFVKPDRPADPAPVPRHEPADITEEPPVGSQVTDEGGGIWERCRDGWTIVGGGSSSEGISWRIVRNCRPLRPTTDEDRKRVGLHVEPAPADVDPDEALAKVACSAFWGSPTKPAANSADWTNVARAVREHIAREQEDALVDSSQQVRAEKAEADVERLTRERDVAEARCERLSVLAEKGERYEPLRAGVERWAKGRSDVSLTTILARDTKRGQAEGDRELFGGSGANAIERGCGEDFRRRFVDPAPDTVTLRREDVERLVAQWVDRGFHESDDGPDPTYLRARAALGWGDDSE